MSIILDALKKAEKGRSGATPPGGENFSPVVEPEKIFPKKGNPFRLLPYALLPILGLILAFMIYRSPLFHQKETVTFSKPKAPVAFIEGRGEKVTKLRDEAMALYQEGKMGESAQKWEKAIKIDPEDAELHNNLGVTLKKGGKKEEAQRSYEKALKLKPDYAEAFNNLGTLLMEGGDTTRAGGFFSQAIAAKTDYAEPHFHLARLLEKEGKPGEARSHYETFLSLARDLPSSLKSQVEFRVLKLK